MALALQTIGNTALQAGEDTSLPQALDFADLRAVLASRKVNGYSDISGAERDLVFAKIEWGKAIRSALLECRRNGTGGLEAAVAFVARHAPDVGRELATAGKCGADARCARNYDNWVARLGTTAAGEPRWQNWEALASRYGQKAPTELNLDYLHLVMQLYLHPHCRKLAACCRQIERAWRIGGRPEEAIATYAQVKCWVRSRLTPSMIERYRGGGRAYAATSRGYVARERNVAPGEGWFGDHRVLDFWVRVPHPENPGQWIARRCWITAITDAATGFIVAVRLYPTSPNSERIAETIQAALLANGGVPPRWFYVDNGKDYLKVGLTTPAKLHTHDGQPLCGPDGKQYEWSVLKALRVALKRAANYNGREKIVERHFGSLGDDYDRSMPGYCGRSPAHRPDPAETYQGDVHALASIEQATARLKEWADTVHHTRKLPDGCTIGQAYAARPDRAADALDQRRLFFSLLLPQAETPIVRRTSVGLCGIHFDGWMYSHADLRQWQGKAVMVKTYWGIPLLTRMRRQVRGGVFVFAPDDTLLCAAPADPSGQMVAETPEERERIGQIQHIINAVAALDRDGFREVTGCERLQQPERVMLRLAEGATDPAVETAAIATAQGQGRWRRLPEATGRPQDPVAPAAEARRHGSAADADLLVGLLSGQADAPQDTALTPVPDSIPAPPAPFVPATTPTEPRRPDRSRDADLLAEIW
jgi:transposase InsO family protein